MDDINIEPEDLEDLAGPTPAPVASAADDLLVIETEDLAAVPPPPSVSTSGWQPAASEGLFPPVPVGAGTGGAVLPKSSLGFSHVAGWGLLHLALAGALGGFLAWAVNEPFTNDATQETDTLTVLLHMSLFGASLGGLIGAALGSVEGLSAGVVDKALRGAGLGLLIGGAGGAIGGLLGQLLYGGLGGGGNLPFLGQVLLRAVAWGLVGVFVGLGQGALGASPRKLLNGVLGGALGGFAGGLLFDPLSGLVQLFISGSGAHAGWSSRMVAMVVLGLCTGAAIALVQELRKEAWVLVAAGPLAGKQFILYRPVTTVGSSPKADICLLKDPGLLPQHLVLEQTGGTHLLAAAPEARVALNGRPVLRQHLRSGDLIGLGQTVLEYRLRALPTGPPL